MTPDDRSKVVRDIFLHWARHSLGRAIVADENGVTIEGKFTARVSVLPLVESEDPRWEKGRELLEDLIGNDLPARVALWVPAGAAIPLEEPDVSEFADIVRTAAVRLGPGERGQVQFPVALKLRKSSESGGVVSVAGGLNPHWARLTDRVQGTFDLDSTAIHRLPESDDFLDGLLDAVVERSASLAVGEIGIVETFDTWTIQRLDGEPGVVILGISPSAATDMGMAVRRNLRRILRDEGEACRSAPEDLKALALVAHYPRMDGEGATTAMRGYDPASYSGIDIVCLVNDGLVKPLIQPPEAALPWNRSAGQPA
jgi:hypothetical protein